MFVLIEQEKQEAVAKATAATTETVTVNVTKSVTDGIAIKLLRSGSSPEFVAENTQLPLADVLKLKEKI